MKEEVKEGVVEMQSVIVNYESMVRDLSDG